MKIEIRNSSRLPIFDFQLLAFSPPAAARCFDFQHAALGSGERSFSGQHTLTALHDQLVLPRTAGFAACQAVWAEPAAVGKNTPPDLGKELNFPHDAFAPAELTLASRPAPQ